MTCRCVELRLLDKGAGGSFSRLSTLLISSKFEEVPSAVGSIGRGDWFGIMEEVNMGSELLL